jgi:hypothetical protein
MTTKAPARGVRFIRERGEPTDEFGAHSRLAQALGRALTDNPPLQVVGLLGKWGSGKSTVVHLVEAELHDKAVRFFLYDAWLHQSDAPRRAFLEELMRWTARQALGDVKPLQDKLDQLLGKSEKTETTVTPTLTIGAGFALAMLLAVPLASQFLKAEWMNDVQFGALAFGKHSFGAVFVAALVVCAAPLLTLLGINLVRLVRSWFGAVKQGGQATALFANKVSETRTDLKTKDPDSTALEFQKFLRDVLDHIRARSKDRLVFVIDNLDRLPDAELLTLWSTIRSLFHGDPGAIDPPPAPTVLLPIDEAAIARVHDEPEVARGFADKTFDVVFRLPTPILTQWQDYLARRLREAFGQDIEQTWIDAAARVLEERGADGRTPRSINAFVNMIATLWMQWGEEVSFPAMALYAAHRSEIEDNIWSFLKNPFPWMVDFDDDWTRGVAALRYGAPPETAGQILIEGPLRDAVAKGDETEFRRLSQVVGFMVVFRRLIDSFRHGSNQIPLSKAALMLASLERAGDQNWKSAWNSLADGITNGAAWSPQHPEDAKALGHVLAQVSKVARARIFRALQVRLSQIPAEQLVDSSTSILDALDLVTAIAKEDGVSLPRLRLHGAAAVELDFAESVGERDLSLLHPSNPPVVLAQELAKRMVPNTEEGEHRDLWRAFSQWQNYVDWSQFVSAVWEKPDDFDIVSRPPIQGLQRAWRHVPLAEVPIQRLTASPSFTEQISACIRQVDGVLPDLLVLGVAAGQSLNQSPNDLRAWAEHNPYAVEAMELRLAKIAGKLTLPRLVDMIGKDPNSAPLYAALVTARLRRTPSQFKLGDILRRPTLYLEVSRNSADDIWRLAASRTNFIRLLRRLPADQFFPLASDLLLMALTPSVTRQVAQIMAELLAALSVEEWTAALISGDRMYEQLSTLGEHFKELIVDGGLTEALGLLLHQAARTDDPELLRRWLSSAQRLSHDERQNLMHLLATDILKDVPLVLSHFMAVANDETVLNELLKVEFGETFLDQVLTPLLSTMDGRHWVAFRETTFASWLARLPQELRSRATEALSAAARSQSGTRTRRTLLALSGEQPS